jgi:PilZ domain
MSAATAMALEKAPQRVAFRKPIDVPLDLIALRSGVPENLPGRCIDLSEGGLGAVVAGELCPGQQVAVELRLPNVGVPVRARALVRYQTRLRCGLEFVGLSAEQREMIRYWTYLLPAKVVDPKEEKLPAAVPKSPAAAAQQAARKSRRFRFGRRKIYALTVGLLVLASLAWWQWQRSWNELEKRSPVVDTGLRVHPELFFELSSEFLSASASSGSGAKLFPQRSQRFTKETGRTYSNFSA